MRIVHLSRDFPPAPSGIGDHVARVSAEMAAMGDDVVVVCSSPAEPRPGIDVRATIERWDDPDHVARAVADARPDAILWHYNPFQVGRRGIPSCAPRMARALSKIAPLTVVAHELWYPWGRSGARGVVWAVAQRVYLRGVLAAASRVLVTTDKRRETVAKRHRDVGVVAAGATVEPSDRPLRPHGDAFVVAHLGAIGEGRDLGPVVEAVGNLRAHGRNVRLLLVGRIGVEPPDAPFVDVTGPLSHDALSDALSNADVYLYAEPIGPVSRKTSLLSALAHGLPVVAYDGPDAERQFRDEENLLLVEPTASAIERALVRLQDDPGLRERLRAGAQALMDEQYSWRAIAGAMRPVSERA